MLIAALPMYDWPETRAETDGEWAALRARLAAAGLDPPLRLVRRNADLPAVEGGIRDHSGRLAAPDPATLRPDSFDLSVLWRHPRLLLAQTCWGPLERGLADHAIVVGQPDYSPYLGGTGPFYSSAVLMRRRGAGEAVSPFRPPDLATLRGQRLAFNGPDSMSGLLGLARDLEAAGESLAVFSERLETGSHRASVRAVAEGRADVCAVDCRSWALAQRHEPAAAELEPVGWTKKRLGLPFIASRHLPRGSLDAVRCAFQDVDHAALA